MKQRIVLILAAVVMVFAMGGCKKADSKAASTNPGDMLVGFAISYAGNDFMQALAESVKQGFIAKGYKCEVAVADGDATKQIEQIENFTTMGAKLIVVMAVDPTGLTDVCKQAREKGCKIAAFTTDVGEQDIYIGSASEQDIGADVAKLANDWVLKNFPNENSIPVAVFGYTGTPEAAQRTEGLKKIATINPKIKMIYVEPKSNTFDAAQLAAENIFQTNKDVKAIICYNSGMCNGVNAYVMSTGSAIADKSKFGTFGSDFSAEVAANIKASAENKSVVRGVVSLGTMSEIVEIVTGPCDTLLKGGSVPARNIGQGTLVTVDNVDSIK